MTHYLSRHIISFDDKKIHIFIFINNRTICHDKTVSGVVECLKNEYTRATRNALRFVVYIIQLCGYSWNFACDVKSIHII